MSKHNHRGEPRKRRLKYLTPVFAVLAIVILSITGAYGINQFALSSPTATCDPTPALSQGANSSSFSVKCSVPNKTVTVTSQPTSTATVTVTAIPSDTPTPTPTQTSSTPSPTTTPTGSGDGHCPSGTVAEFYPGQKGGDAYGGGSESLSEQSNPYAQWNASAEEWGIYSEYRQTMCVFSTAHWTVDATVTNHQGAVQAYPSMRKIYHDWSSNNFTNDPKLSTFPILSSTFAQTDPSCSNCIYDDAYDIWLNGISSNGDTELMIWTHNSGQYPYGNKVASGVQLSGHTWDVYYGKPDYVAYVPTDVNNISSGNFDLKGFISDAAGRGLVQSNASDPKVGQVSYGVETVSTGAVSKHWDFNNFTITDK